MDALAAAAAIGQRFEGCSLGAYPDPISGGAPWTIGWGNTCRLDGRTVREGDRLADRPEADALQLHALGLIRAKFPALVRVALQPWEEAALLDFAFNLGSSALAGSTLLRLVNANRKAAAAEQFERWGNARVGGRLVPVAGLQRRRAFERLVFRGEIDPTGPATSAAAPTAAPAPATARAVARTAAPKVVRITAAKKALPRVRTFPNGAPPGTATIPAMTTAALNDAECARMSAATTAATTARG